MINIFIPGTKEKPKSYSVSSSSYATSVNIPPLHESMQFEITRRDNIVKDLARNCPFKPGDTATPVSPAAKEKWGKKILVQKICGSYAHLGKDEPWPKTDNPMIITAWSHEKKTALFCTVDFLEKA